MPLVERIQELCSSKNTTLIGLERAINIGRGTIRKWDSYSPSVDKLQKVADYFGVSTEYLLGKSPFRSPSETKYSIIVAVIKKLLNDEKYKIIGYDELLWKSAEDKARILYGDKVLAFVKSMRSKQTPTDTEYFKLSKLISQTISWPDDFNGPTTLMVQGKKISCDIDYWDIPKIRYFEGYFNEPDFEYDMFVTETEPCYKAGDSSFETSVEEEHNFIVLPKMKKICRIPVLGSIPAGMPVEAVQDIIGWSEIPEDWMNGGRQYFGLQVHGDSMYPEYLDGDTVIVRKQPTCDSGDDCVVMVNSTDATLKKVNILEDGIELEAINKMYGRKKFTKNEVISLPVTVLGVVVELRRKKK